eukprot:NODE_10378_length_308_cov_201.067194.p3 GENE.NODE_10378_length_308_cov_201.067194~~NODE_10378_length_308_cov_201.067194.p3  ORF type:complete len:53 (+),score=5.83 NODE_10378_length_308_cov_201.067194:105-263(+)
MLRLRRSCRRCALWRASTDGMPAAALHAATTVRAPPRLLSASRDIMRRPYCD